jgi:hypothetical protein
VQKFPSFEEMLAGCADNPVIHVESSQDPADYEIADCEDWPPTALSLKPSHTANYSEIVAVPLVVPPYWRFHKNDPDPWPSLLHGHHSQKPLKLDAITGFIYRIQTRKQVQRLKEKALREVQAALLASKDFREKALALLGG